MLEAAIAAGWLWRWRWRCWFPSWCERCFRGCCCCSALLCESETCGASHRRKAPVACLKIYCCLPPPFSSSSREGDEDGLSLSRFEGVCATALGFQCRFLHHSAAVNLTNTTTAELLCTSLVLPPIGLLRSQRLLIELLASCFDVLRAAIPSIGSFSNRF